jgi:hypothetical protein
MKEPTVYIEVEGKATKLGKGATATGATAGLFSSGTAKVVPLLDKGMSHVRDGIDLMKKHLKGIAEGVDEVELSFSVELSAEHNYVVFKAGGKGAIGVKIKWKKDGVSK